MKIKTQKAITLMELIVVIVIIAIIAGFGIPNYSKALLKSYERDAELQLIALHAASITYFAGGDEFLPDSALSSPTDLDGLNTGLGINIIPNGFSYSYDRSTAPDEFVATATWDPGGSDEFIVQVTEAPTGSGSNPCCQDFPNCPTLPTC